MKTPSKIILLVLFVIIAVGAVLVFVKTQVAPPGDIEFKDQYSAPLNADVDKIGAKSFPENYAEFAKLNHKVNFMTQEKILTNDQADGLKMKMDTVYGNRMVQYAYRMFNSSVWPDDNIKRISKTISDLRGNKLHNGQSAITTDMDASFRNVENVLNDYRNALSIANNTSFKSVSDASSKISRANDYKNKQYLSNNSSLMSKLNAVPGKLAAAHYNYVAGQVKKLAGYYNMSESYFYNTLAPQVDRAIDEYKNTGIYGGAKKSAQSLVDQAQNYLSSAYNYYNYYSSPSYSSGGSSGGYYYEEDPDYYN